MASISTLMNSNRKNLLIIVFLVGIAGYTYFIKPEGPPALSRIISPTGVYTKIVWKPVDLAKKIAVKTLKRINETSHHIIRLKGKEKPHFHRDHDLMVIVLTGKAVFHYPSSGR